MVVEDLQHIVPDLKKVSQKKILLVWGAVTVSLLVLSLGLAVAVGVLAWHGGGQGQGRAAGQGGSPGTCATPGCLHAAAWMVESLDPQANPCEDFYQYACGGWINRHSSMPPDQERMSVLEGHRTRNGQVHWQLIEAPIARPDPQSYERKLKQFFTLCKDEYGRMKAGGAELVDAVQNALGGVYVLGAQAWPASWQLNRALAAAHSQLLVPALYMYHVVPHPTRQGTNIISITNMDMLMDPVLTNHPITDQQIAAYETFQRSAVRLLMRDAGLDPHDQDSATRLEQLITDVRQVEQLVIQMHQTEESQLYTTFDRGQIVNLRELNQNFTQVDWVAVFSQIFSKSGVAADTEVMVQSMDYLRKLNSMLANLDSQNAPRILNNYLVWQTLSVYSEFLSWEYRHLRYKYQESLTGVATSRGSWETCMYVTKFHMAPAVMALFAKKHIGDQGKDKVEEMFGYVRDAMSRRLQRLRWMDEETRKLAITKVEAMKDMLGYPRVLTDDSKMDAIFAELTVNSSASFLHNLLLSNRFLTSELNAELQGKTGLGLWEYVLLTPDFGTWIHYFWAVNTVLVPPGIAQFPFFSADSPGALNFGGLGSRVAQEIVHTVDELGSYFYNDTFKFWWTNTTKWQFKEAEKCMLGNFNNKEVGPFLVNGENRTVKLEVDHQTWNIFGRTAGIGIAYDAYMDWMAAKGNESPFPGTQLTNAQLFYLSTAQTRCSVQRDEAAFHWAQYGFIPEKFLINTIMAQQESFSDAFQCKPGQRLVPEKRCYVF